MAYQPKELSYADIKQTSLLGSGAYGSVYKINGEELSKKLGVGECFGDCWVVKRSKDSEDNEATIREIANIVSMKHLNIINLFAAGSDGLYSLLCQLQYLTCIP